MKTSRYNFFFRLNDGRFLAYNALRNGLAVVNQNVRETIEKLQPGQERAVPDDTLERELERGGFVIPDDYDEFGVLKIRRHIQQFGTNSLGLTIAPTINCNLSCKYCFENPGKAVVTPEIQDKIVEFAKTYVESGVKQLSVTWYGGEPLLCMNEIERLGNKFIELCKEHKVDYSADIITNGTLLTKETAEKLKTVKVRSAQITLDGNRATHDARRPYRGGKGSFDTIVERLEECAGILPISLRINVDQGNVAKALSFYKWLQDQEWFDNKTMSAYFGYIRKYTSSCRCSQDECLLPGDFWKREHELQQHIVENGIAEPNYPDISSGCGATRINSYVIGPKGELYKCWNHLGDTTQVVGNIDAPVELSPLYQRYLTEGFENDPECRECRFLPICMGGCVDMRIKALRGDLAQKDCSRWKYYLKNQLKLYYQYKMKANEKNTKEDQEVVSSQKTQV